MTVDPPAPVQPGDMAPAWYGMLQDGGFHSSEAQAGRPAVLILAGSLPPPSVAATIESFAGRRQDLQAIGADIVVLASASALWATAPAAQLGPLVVHCPSPAVFARAGMDSGKACVLAVDRAQRVITRIDGGAPDAAADAMLAALRALTHEAPREVSRPSPVLIVPNLIGDALRRALIDHFECGRQVDGAMASMDADGQGISRVDAAKKHRRDCTLEPGEALHGAVLDVLGGRLLPEIKKAFQADVAHVDRILIARYDDTGGYFRRHRDNSAAQVAFRQFALSLNLNTGDYEGGALRFPEFSDDAYQPPAGSACVFSASLLHEATPVTRGSRYVLLTFLHDDAAEARRQAQIAAVDGCKAA